MLKRTVETLLQLHPTVDSLSAAIAGASGLKKDAIEDEVKEHLATRLAFLLLGEIASVSNYDAFEARIRRRLPATGQDVTVLVESLAALLSNTLAAESCRKPGIADLPYPVRKSMLRAQRHRCAVCGFSFLDDESDGNRSPQENAPTLDHRVPFRLGGDELANLWILCGRCNSTKEARVHVGESGRPWINNFVYSTSTRSLAFWTMWRDRQCTEVGCEGAPNTTRLYVQRRNERGEWFLDNLVTRCGIHSWPEERLAY